MTASWKYSIGLSLALFVSMLTVFSLLTPAYRDEAAAINSRTLNAASAR